MLISKQKIKFCSSLFLVCFVILETYGALDKCAKDPGTQEMRNILENLKSYLIISGIPNYLYYHDYPYKIDQFLVVFIREYSAEENITSTAEILCDSEHSSPDVGECRWHDIMLEPTIRWELLTNSMISLSARTEKLNDIWHYRNASRGFRHVDLLKTDMDTYWRIEGCVQMDSEEDLSIKMESTIDVIFLGVKLIPYEKPVEKCSPRNDLCLDPELNWGVAKYSKVTSALFLSIKDNVDIISILKDYNNDKKNGTSSWQLWVPVIIFLSLIVCIGAYIFGRGYIKENINSNRISTVY